MNFHLPPIPNPSMAAVPHNFIYTLPPHVVAYLVAAFNTDITFEHMSKLIQPFAHARTMWLAYNMLVIRPQVALLVDEVFLRTHGTTYLNLRSSYQSGFRNPVSPIPRTQSAPNIPDLLRTGTLGFSRPSTPEPTKLELEEPKPSLVTASPPPEPRPTEPVILTWDNLINFENPLPKKPAPSVSRIPSPLQKIIRDELRSTR